MAQAFRRVRRPAPVPVGVPAELPGDPGDRFAQGLLGLAPGRPLGTPAADWSDGRRGEGISLAGDTSKFPVLWAYEKGMK